MYHNCASNNTGVLQQVTQQKSSSQQVFQCSNKLLGLNLNKQVQYTSRNHLACRKQASYSQFKQGLVFKRQICRAQGEAIQESPAQQPIKWGANMKSLSICVAVGTLIWFIPVPQGLTKQAWQLLACFVATIVGIILQPVPLGAVAMLGLGVTMLTKTLTFPQAFSAFTNEIPWLIATAYWIAQGFIDTGLGKRLAYNIVKAFGKTTLGMTYSLVIAEALVAPLMPSVAARAGGIFFPLAKALCISCDSEPEKGTAAKMGSYVMLTSFLCTTISSGMFVTAMAANPLSANLAEQTLGYGISWGMWAKSALLPGLICLLLTPLILYVIYPPEVKSTPQAPAKASEELKRLGPLSTNEKITAFALLITVALWIAGPNIGVNNVAAALVGFSILLITGVISWKKCLNNNQAWDTLTWFAALIGMAAYLNKLGFISWFSSKVVIWVQKFGMQWQGTFALISTLYFYSHYLFASGSAHIGAMYTAFLSVSIACGAPGLPAALLLAQISNVMGCLTNYGIGSAPPYFGANYVPQNKWYMYGFIMSVFYLSTWLLVGLPYWKFLGIW